MQKVVIICFLLFSLLSACSNNEETVQNKEEKKGKVEQEQVVKEAPVEEEKKQEMPSYLKAAKRALPVSTQPVDIGDFKPNPIMNENKATYNLDLTMVSNGEFKATAEVRVENNSKDTWNEIVFYFIPNAFTLENKPEFIENAAEVSIDELKVDGEKINFILEHDTLYLPVTMGFKPGEQKTVKVSYSFTLPENGIRFSKNSDNFYLAEWYPMLATYHSGWKKEDYITGGESYYTDFSDFTVKYNLPEEYLVMSSADDDPNVPSRQGELHGLNIKEFYLSFTKEMRLLKKKAGEIEVRVAGTAEVENLEKLLDTAVNAISFFSENLSPYPQKQIDVIADEGGMEYPGIVTVGKVEGDFSDQGRISTYFALIHEIAHQWFYGVVNSDPYYDTYLDEGLTNFSTYLFLIAHDKKTPGEAFRDANEIVNRTEDAPPIARLPLHEYKNRGFMVSNYELPSLKLWELTKDEKTAFDYLKKYVELYSYKEVDSYEWIRFTKAYFNVRDDAFFREWISYE